MLLRLTLSADFIQQVPRARAYVKVSTSSTRPAIVEVLLEPPVVEQWGISLQLSLG